MNGTEIITFLSNNLDTISSAVGPVAGALYSHFSQTQHQN